MCVYQCSLYHIYWRESAERTNERRRGEILPFEFFYFFIFFFPFSDRGRKVGAKNRQLPNERQLSGDQLQEGPAHKMQPSNEHCSASLPFSTCLSFSFWPSSPLSPWSRNFSHEYEGRERKDGEKEKGKRNACRFRLVRRTRSVY